MNRFAAGELYLYGVLTGKFGWPLIDTAWSACIGDGIEKCHLQTHGKIPILRNIPTVFVSAKHLL